MKVNRKLRQPVSARRWIDQHYLDGGYDPVMDRKPGSARKFIHHFEELKDVRYVILHLRVSSSDQNRNGNLRDTELELRRVMRGRGIKVVGIIREVVSGYVLGESDQRWKLVRAGKLAKRAGAAIVSYCTDRFVRNEYFDTKRNNQAWPTIAEFKELKRLTGDVTLATVIDPDATLNEVRGTRSKLGQQAKGRNGGRPRMRPKPVKAIRCRMLPKARKLWEAGVPVRQIARKLGIAHKTVDGWIQRFKMGVRFF